MNTPSTIAGEGLSVVAAPPGATSDIVFVHGLQGHPEKTWTCHDLSQAPKRPWLSWRKKDKAELRRGIFWPSDLLSREDKLQNARILTYGYDSVVANFFGPQNQQNITRHGNNLMVALQQERKEEPDRPLIFVAHSLGGILVKIALLDSKNSLQPKFVPIVESTKGIVFLGTPHSGSHLASWGLLATNLAKLALQGPNQKVLRALVPNNELLERISKQFCQLLDQSDFSVHSFYETLPMSIYGIDGTVVPYESATLKHVKREVEVAILADHRGVCKFGVANDAGYKAVLGAITDYLETSSNKAQRSEVCKTHDVHPNHIYSRDDTASLATDPRNMAASPYGSLLSENHSFATTAVFIPQYSNASPGTTDPDQLMHYLSGIGLSEGKLKAYGHLQSLFKEEKPSVKHEWFFDSPDFIEWDEGSVTRILELGGQSRQENLTIFLELLRFLHDQREAKVIYFSPSFREDEQSGRLKPLEHSHRLLRTLVSQLAEGLFRLLYHLLIGQSRERRVYVLIDSLEVLGHEMGGFIAELLSLQDKLRKPKSADESEPIVKIFISTLPQTRPKGMQTGQIIYIDKNKEMQDCLQTLNSADFDARPGTVHDPDPSTYEWLEQDESYTEWESSDVSSLLLIVGKPGSGKSTLAKRIVNAIKSSSDFENSLVAYFFYSYRGGQKETSHTIMMQSILYQLLSEEPDFFPAFRQAYRDRRRSDGNAFCWNLKELVGIFSALSNVKRDGKIFVILDAMDESDNKDLPVILRSMKSVCSPQSLGLFKGVMTTRPLPRKAIDLDLQTLTEQSLIMEDKNESDISKVVDRQIEAILEAGKSSEGEFDSAVLDDIKSYIKKHAEGVFLWVDLILREFKSLSDEGFSKFQLRELKTMLPPKLNDVYQQITVRLAKSKPKDIEQGRKLLQLASFSLERLRLEEIRDASIIPSYLENDQFDPDLQISDLRVMRFDRRVKAVCGDLLENRNPFVQLIHESVRDFLLREDQSAAPFHMSVEQGKNVVASVFTRYLAWSLSTQVLVAAGIKRDNIAEWEQDDYKRLLELLEDRPLLNYVISSLPRHIESTTDKRVKDEFSFLLKDLGHSQLARYLLLDSTFSSLLALDTDDKVEDASNFRFKILVLAAKLGCVKAIRQLATVNTPMEPAEDETETDPLHAAIASGQDETVELLLSLHANPFFKDRLGEMSVHKAVTHNQFRILKTLLDNDVYSDASSLTYETPLHLAAARGYDDMVELLLDHEAVVDFEDQYDATPLHKAVQNNHLLVARILLDHEADVDADAKYTGTPLHIAVDNKSIEMAELLLEYHADVDEAGEYGATPLHSAASEGQADMISLLKEHGASVVEKDRYVTFWTYFMLR
ncbi:Ankyrin repeat-containing domain-containing protein [Cordyceps javanica]|uniref:Ankyrin repeat-containing domain-containing protein n=1 Tax=Cordyceps javanica TaxID=43265 RepID=A0A545V4S9_9HYPO|nr:Ankyrin repeat-containing domain-containing protein [Cordyceps javanica]TQW07989.1 Ankyrin repeat-containing domain protein [Cordyceps javanica]